MTGFPRERRACDGGRPGAGVPGEACGAPCHLRGAVMGPGVVPTRPARSPSLKLLGCDSRTITSQVTSGVPVAFPSALKCLTAPTFSVSLQMVIDKCLLEVVFFFSSVVIWKPPASLPEVAALALHPLLFKKFSGVIGGLVTQACV